MFRCRPENACGGKPSKITCAPDEQPKQEPFAERVRLRLGHDAVFNAELFGANAKSFCGETDELFTGGGRGLSGLDS